jgi:hypothetical protein
LACIALAGGALAGEWRELFNGENLDGWEQKGGEAKYKVEDGAIVGTSVPNTPNSFLVTQDTFGDFILEFEFKGHPDLNSGVQIRSNSLESYKDGRVHGYQVELEDEAQDRDWSGGIYDEGRRGWLFPTKKDKKWGEKFGAEGKAAYKDGEWNTIRVEAKGDSIKTFLNGTPRADLEDGLTSEGFIALQVHGVGDKEEPMSVSWRNIRIQELDGDE